MITPERAWELLEAHLQPLTSERVARREALGRVLAAAEVAQVDVPPCDVSAVDGYALRGERPEGEAWPVLGRVAAGDAPGFALPAGAAVRIMTGAPVPRAAERVVPVELTDRGLEAVRLLRDEPRGANIRRGGEVVRAGQPMLEPGARLTPGALALLATHGRAELSIHRRPTVAVLATGDEVVPPEVEPGPGQLRDSNSEFLLAAGRTLGLDFEPLGIAPDREAELEALVRQGLGRDVLLLCGGVSMGELDLVEGVLGRLGCRPLFDAVAVQPGKPLVSAVHPGGLVFGLPGNPASVAVSFWLFVRPALRRLSGLESGFWREALTGVLEAELPGAGPRDRFLPATVRFVGGEIRVRPAPPRGSHDLLAYGQGSGLVRIRAGAAPVPAGGACEILPLVDWLEGADRRESTP
jgi:molybdopterin molybdotransferase